MTHETGSSFWRDFFLHGHDDHHEAALKYHTSDATDRIYQQISAFRSSWAQVVADKWAQKEAGGQKARMRVSEWNNECTSLSDDDYEGTSLPDDDCLSCVSCESIDPSKYLT